MLPSIALASGPKVVGSILAGRILSVISDEWSVTRNTAAPRSLVTLHWNFRPRENFLSQCFEPAEQILLARDSDHLVA
jgi:hypothetical protein